MKEAYREERVSSLIRKHDEREAAREKKDGPETIRASIYGGMYVSSGLSRLIW
jgi:hypothetical protein